MASRTMNDSIRALRERHAQAQAALQAQQRAEQSAMELVATAAGAVAAARDRRAAALAQLDAAVVDAERDQEVALAVLAVFLGDDEAAATVAGVDLTAVRTARRRAPRELVDATIARVRDSSGRRRGVGRRGQLRRTDTAAQTPASGGGLPPGGSSATAS